jgi:hypothetical protein
MKIKFVLCDVGTKLLYTLQINFNFQMVFKSGALRKMLGHDRKQRVKVKVFRYKPGMALGVPGR